MSQCKFFEIQDCFSSEPKSEDKSFTSAQKWWISLALALIFLIISSPFIYALTNGLSLVLGLPPMYVAGGGATTYGLFWHFIIFFLLTRLLMG